MYFKKIIKDDNLIYITLVNSLKLCLIVVQYLLETYKNFMLIISF